MSRDIIFCGNSLDEIRSFPKDAKVDAGHQLHRLQEGLNPDDWKPMRTVGPGVKEIRIADATGAFRVFYVANRKDGIYVLHAFQKTTQQTEKRDIDLGKARLKELPR